MKQLIVCVCISLSALQSFAQTEKIAEAERAILKSDTLEYWIDLFQFQIPGNILKLPKEFKSSPQKIRLDSSDKLNKELQQVRAKVGQWDEFYNYAFSNQRDGKRFSAAYLGITNDLFAFNGYLTSSNRNELTLTILGDSLGNILRVTLGSDFNTKTGYYFSEGKLQMIRVLNDIPERTGWETVSYDRHDEEYYFGGAGLFAIERYWHPIEESSRRIVQTKKLQILSDSLEKKARMILQLAKYISTYPGTRCRAVKPQRIGTAEAMTKFFNDKISKDTWAQTRKKGMIVIDFEIDTNGNVTKVIEDRWKPGIPIPPLNIELDRILLTTKWIPAMAGCKPRKDKLTLMGDFDEEHFTSISAN